MKKAITTISFLFFLAICSNAQFESIRGLYRNPIHTGILLDSIVLPKGNFKSISQRFDASTDTWVDISQTVYERTNSRINKQSSINYLTSGAYSVTIVGHDFGSDGIIKRTVWRKTATSNDTVLTSIDTFIYNNGLLIKQLPLIDPTIGSEYVYDSLGRLIETKQIAIDSSTLFNITFVGNFKVKEYNEFNKPKHLEGLSYAYNQVGELNISKTSDFYYHYNESGLTISLSQYSYPFGQPLLSDSIFIEYSNIGLPISILNTRNNRVVNYSYNASNEITEFKESNSSNQPLSRTIYTNDLALSLESKQQNNIPILIYPNPASTSFRFLLLDERVLAQNLSVYTLSGALVHHQVNVDSFINVNLPNGHYLVEIDTNMGKVYKPLVISK